MEKAHVCGAKLSPGEERKKKGVKERTLSLLVQVSAAARV